MTTFRYRQLFAVRDAEAVAVMKAEFEAQALRPREYLAAGARAEDEAPKAVHANESTATQEELTRMLQEGELMPSDLVFSHGAWTTFEQSAEFYEACEGVTDTRSNAQHRAPVVRLIIGLILAAVVIWLRML